MTLDTDASTRDRGSRLALSDDDARKAIYDLSGDARVATDSIQRACLARDPIALAKATAVLADAVRAIDSWLL